MNLQRKRSAWTPDQSCLERRLKLEAIFNSVSDGIMALDQNLVISSINKSAAEILGILPEDAVGQKYDQILSLSPHLIKDFQRALDDVQKNLNRIEDLHVTFEPLEARGQQGSAIFSLEPLIDVEGEPAGAILIFKDTSEIERLRDELQGRYRFHNLIGKSPQMQQIYQLIQQTAESSASVLIEGESGTGKELVARAIHYNSPHAKAPFIAVNCSALPETLLESELFGHVRGAFTGAIRDRVGRFEAADGGTLFLDEVGDISPLVQLKLLRFLQEREFERVGDRKTVKVDVRIIAATNKNLKSLINEGRFREDLYYRLRVVPIILPPLRERKEDIPLVVNHFVAKFQQQTNKAIKSVTKLAMAAMLDYNWPGNVRELENAIEHAFVRGQSNKIELIDLPKELSERRADKPLRRGGPAVLTKAEERNMVIQALSEAKGNKSKAAKLLGLGRTTLYKRLKEYKVKM